MDRMLEATKRIKAASIIVRRLMPENRSGRTGAATETASAKTLTQRPAVETVTSKRSAICGMMPTTPISVLMMPKTPSVRMAIRSDSFWFALGKHRHERRASVSKRSDARRSEEKRGARLRISKSKALG